MKTNVLFYIGGCTGSYPAQPLRFVAERKNGHETEVLRKPLPRNGFGASTTSFALVVGDEGYLIDNGTGASQSFDALVANKVRRISVLHTHYHADHTMGLTANPLLFRPDLLSVLCGPNLGSANMQTVMDHVFTPWNWPVSPATFGIGHNYLSFKPGNSIVGLSGTEIKTLALNHPGGATAYRITTEKGDVVIATDNEPTDEVDQVRLASFAEGASLLYVDMQYRDGEYSGAQAIGFDRPAPRQKWGHATPAMIGKVLERMQTTPKRLVVGHHDPKRIHDDLVAFETEVKTAFETFPATEVSFARECEMFEV